MLLALLLLAAPIADEVSGPPEPRPQLAPAPVHGTLPLGWYLEGGAMRTTLASGPLFDDSAQGPRGEPVGTACVLTTPASFPLARAALSTGDVTFRVLGDYVFYVPVLLHKPVRVTVWRNNAAGKDPVGEVLLGVLTLGLSTLRLAPSVAITVQAPAKGRGAAGGFSVECRTVGRESVERAMTLKECATLSCLAEQVALLGPHDEALQARAQALVDQNLQTVHDWRAAATWQLRSFEILSSARCGAQCVKLTVRNTSPVAQRFPRYDDALDANGRHVQVIDDVFTSVDPGETRAVKLSLDLRETLNGGTPRFPVVMRIEKDTWAHAPGAFTEAGIEYRFGAPRCKGTRLTMPVTMRCLAGHDARTADYVWLWLPNGDEEVLHLPGCSSPYAEDEAWTSVSEGLPCEVSAVSVPTATPAFVLLP